MEFEVKTLNNKSLATNAKELLMILQIAIKTYEASGDTLALTVSLGYHPLPMREFRWNGENFEEQQTL